MDLFRNRQKWACYWTKTKKKFKIDETIIQIPLMGSLILFLTVLYVIMEHMRDSNISSNNNVIRKDPLTKFSRSTNEENHRQHPWWKYSRNISLVSRLYSQKINCLALYAFWYNAH